MNAKWLSNEQKSRMDLMSREELQELTDKTESLVYFSISNISQKGGCVGASLFERITVKGQAEDANMAGVETIYEFRKIGGHWTKKLVATLIS